MTHWTTFTNEEMERRRRSSADAMKEIKRVQWGVEYQEKCDSIYWDTGKCCAGCDHWQSEDTLRGRCSASDIVSGQDVLRSMGISWSSWVPARVSHSQVLIIIVVNS